MTNKKMTQEEFDAIERDECGFKNIPANTDLTLIRSFGERCSFGKGCRFGESCSFGKGCRFGELCSFGEGCRFGELCSFGERCSFGELCSFGEGCRFGERCSYKGNEFKHYYQFGGFGSVERTTRVYLLTNNTVLIECGCQVGLTLTQFKDRVEKQYDKGTRFGGEYRAIIAVIETIIKNDAQDNEHD